MWAFTVHKEAQLDEALGRLPTEERVATGCFKSDAVKPSQAEGGGNSTTHSHNSTPTHEEVCAGFVSAAPVTEERQQRGVKHLDGSTDNPVHDLTAKLTAFYAILNPSKLCDVAKLAVKFKDNADKLNSDLRRRYDGLDLSSPEAEIWRYRYDPHSIVPRKPQVRDIDKGPTAARRISIVNDRSASSKLSLPRRCV